MTEQSAHTFRIAVIDTDAGFLRVLHRRLQDIGWEHRTHSGVLPVDEFVSMKLGGIIVDIAALGDRGWDFLAEVCGTLPNLGVVVCTERSTLQQRIRGLRLGADDWVTKPCHPEELLARVEAACRRRKRAEPVSGDTAMHGPLEIRPDHFQAYVDGESVELTRREFELVEVLAQAQGRVIEREEIYQQVWGYAMARGDRSVDVFVRKLRRKLAQRIGGWEYIHTHFGVGYRFEPVAVGGGPASDAAAPDPAFPTATTTAAAPQAAPR
ncbi:MAG: response regulator transcription factor [Solirubrobacterales bacterium]